MKLYLILQSVQFAPHSAHTKLKETNNNNMN